jgi:hypothetical protein
VLVEFSFQNARRDGIIGLSQRSSKVIMEAEKLDLSRLKSVSQERLLHHLAHLVELASAGNAAELENICSEVLSIADLLINSTAKRPDSDQKAKMEIIKSKTFSMQQTVEKFDGVKLEPNVLKKVCEQMLFMMICLLRPPNGVQGFDPGSTIATMRQLILILAQQCANESALRAFYQVVKEIERSVR